MELTAEELRTVIQYRIDSMDMNTLLEFAAYYISKEVEQLSGREALELYTEATE